MRKTTPSVPHSRDAWASIVESFKHGSYEACVAKLHPTQSSKACALRARSLIRLSREADALIALSAVDDRVEDAEVLGERDSLASLALLRLGRFAEARLTQASAREHLSTVTAWAIRSELRYHEACLSFAVGDSQKAYDTALASDRNIISYYERATHEVISVTSSRAALKNSAAVVDVSRSRYPQALDGFIEAFAICRSDPTCDVGVVSRIIFNIAGGMNECSDRQADSLKLVLEATNEIAWTDELGRTRFYILRAIAHAFALFGDFETAFKMLEEATECATTKLERLLSRLDRIVILRDLGHSDISKGDLRELDDDVASVPLSQCVEADVEALLLVGEHLAEVNVSSARSLQAAYSNVSTRRVRLTTAFSDGRFAAQNQRLDAVLALARGDLGTARELNRQAFDFHERLGNRLSAGQVALDLSVTDGGRPYREYARDTALRWPNSSFAIKAVRQHPQFRRSVALARSAQSRTNA